MIQGILTVEHMWVVSLPMRDGNNVANAKIFAPDTVVSLPMRDGNSYSRVTLPFVAYCC